MVRVHPRLPARLRPGFGEARRSLKRRSKRSWAGFAHSFGRLRTRLRRPDEAFAAKSGGLTKLEQRSPQSLSAPLNSRS